jgi:arginase
VSWHCQTLAGNVEKELRQGRRVVTIGGDHSMAAASVSGAAAAFGPDATIGLIWIDAHADINTMQSSVSKALHGMPMAALLGLDDGLCSLGAPRAVLKPQNIVYAGLRDIDAGEYEVAESVGLSLPLMADIRRDGVSTWLQDAVTHLSGRCDHMVLSIDLDAFSLDVAPSVGTPVPGGFMPDEILPVLSGIVRAYAIDMIDIVEFNPKLSGAAVTAKLIEDILVSLLPGKAIQK